VLLAGTHSELARLSWFTSIRRHRARGLRADRVVAVEGLENRVGFNGVVAFDRETYVGRDVAHLFRPGSANPVRYLPLDALLPDPSIPPTTAATPTETFADEAVEPGLLERVLPLLDAFEHDLL
jgi:hypothetical protein